MYPKVLDPAQRYVDQDRQAQPDQQGATEDRCYEQISRFRYVLRRRISSRILRSL